MRADDGTKLDGRQGAAASAGTKGLIDVGRPFLDFVISGLADAGVTEVCLVVAPGANPFRDHYAANPPKRVKISFAIQKEPLGTANAVAAAGDFFAEGALVLNSDNYYPPAVLKKVLQASKTGHAVTAGFDRDVLVANSNIPAARVAAFALLDEADGLLRDIVEKPTPQELARLSTAKISMNCWFFPAQIISACENIELSPRGEYEIADAVRALIAAGTNVTVVPVAAGVLDLSRRADIPQVTQALADVKVAP